MSDETGSNDSNPSTNVRPGARGRGQAESPEPAPEPTKRLNFNELDDTQPRPGSADQAAPPPPVQAQPSDPAPSTSQASPTGQQWGPPEQRATPQAGQQWGPPDQQAPAQQGQWGPPGQPAASQPPPAYAPPSHAQPSHPQPGYAAPSNPGKRANRSAGTPGRRTVGIGLLAGALILGAGAGFGGGYLQGETSDGGGSADGKVDAGQIDIGGVNLQDLVSVQTVADKALPSVVKIEAFSSSSGSTGSGIILSDDGLILTNYHVAYNGIEGDLQVYFDDGASSTATVVGTDPDLDIAIIKADDVSGLTPMEFGDADDLHVGQAVVAVGSPYGLESTVTAGIISTVNRPVNVPGMDSSQEAMIYPALQTDAAINPGNSGGALVNIKGELVGMNSGNRLAVDTTGSTGDLGSIGIGYAIPINVLEPIIEQLKDGGEATHAWLGIVPGNARQSGVAQGARVDDFTSDSPAEKAGLQQGDVVVRIDDYPIAQGLGLVTTALNYRPGDTVKVTVVRDGEEQQFDVELGEKARLFDEF